MRVTLWLTKKLQNNIISVHRSAHFATSAGLSAREVQDLPDAQGIQYCAADRLVELEHRKQRKECSVVLCQVAL